MSTDPEYLIRHHPDWISSEKYEYSLDKLAAAHPEGVPDRLLASVLMIPRDEVEGIYEEILVKLRLFMGITPGEDQ